MSWLNQNSPAVDWVGHCLSSWMFLPFCCALFFFWIRLFGSHLIPQVGVSVCKRCVFLFCSYVERYVLEFWFRLVISNIIVGYKTKVKSCSSLFWLFPISVQEYLSYVTGLLLCLPALGFQLYSLIKIWEMTHLLHQLPLWPAGKLFCITAFCPAVWK